MPSDIEVAAAPARLTILVPTYNRAQSLSRAIQSVIAQTRSDFTVLISDNASEDETEEVCLGYARRDPRIQYFRQPVNLGPIGNFNWLLQRASTDFLQMLADDDWLDVDYVERCLSAIEVDPELSMVTGATRYYEGDAPPDLLLDTDLTDDSGAKRVVRYLGNSWSSAAFYGVLRTSMARDALPIPNVMGADWLFVAALAFAGKAITVGDTHLNRARGGTSVDFGRIAAVSGLSSRAARHPHLAIACNQFRDIAFSCRSYDGLPSWRRVVLGAAAAWAVIAEHPFDVFWDTFGPLILHRRVIAVTGPLRDRWRARHPI